MPAYAVVRFTELSPRRRSRTEIVEFKSLPPPSSPSSIFWTKWLLDEYALYRLSHDLEHKPTCNKANCDCLLWTVISYIA